MGIWTEEEIGCGGTEIVTGSDGYEYDCEGCEDCAGKVTGWDFVVREADGDKSYLGRNFQEVLDWAKDRLDEIEQSGRLADVGGDFAWWVEVHIKGSPYIAGDIYRNRIDYDGHFDDLDVECAIDDAVGVCDEAYFALLDRVDDVRERAGIAPLND